MSRHAPQTLDVLEAAGRPVVRLGWVLPLEQMDQVPGGGHEAGSAIGYYLLARGHRDLGSVHGSRVLRGRMERLFALREAGLRQLPFQRLMPVPQTAERALVAPPA